MAAIKSVNLNAYQFRELAIYSPRKRYAVERAPL